MKKKISAVLLAVLILSAFAVIPSFAEETDSIDGKMIIHWDFEGTTLEEQLSNKAAAGSKKDSVSLFTDGNKSKVEDGAIHITSDTTEYMRFIIDKGNGKGANLLETATKQCTFYTRFKVSGEANNTTTAFAFNYNKNDALKARYYLHKEGTGILRLNNDKKTNTSVTDNMIYDDSYVSLAVTYSLTEGGKAEIKLYVSYFDWLKGSTMVSTSNLSQYNGLLWVDGSEMLFGGKMSNQLSTGSSPTDLNKDFYYDDIRIYNTVLTPEEIMTIKPLNAEEPKETETDAVTENTDSTEAATGEDAKATSATSKAVTESVAATGESTEKGSGGCKSSLEKGALLTVGAALSVAVTVNFKSIKRKKVNR